MEMQTFRFTPGGIPKLDDNSFSADVKVLLREDSVF